MINNFSKNISNLIIQAALVAVLIVPALTGAQSAEGNPPPAQAQGESIKQSIEIKNPFSCGGKPEKDCTIPDLLRSLINDILMPIGAVVAVGMVMWAGFLYVTARGNAAQISNATNALKYSVIGAAILLGAWVISEAIQGTVNQLQK